MLRKISRKPTEEQVNFRADKYRQYLRLCKHISGWDALKLVKPYHGDFTLDFEYLFIICNNRQISVVFLDLNLHLPLLFSGSACLDKHDVQTIESSGKVCVLLNLEADIFISETEWTGFLCPSGIANISKTVYFRDRLQISLLI